VGRHNEITDIVCGKVRLHNPCGQTYPPALTSPTHRARLPLHGKVRLHNPCGQTYPPALTSPTHRARLPLHGKVRLHNPCGQTYPPALTSPTHRARLPLHGKVRLHNPWCLHNPCTLRADIIYPPALKSLSTQMLRVRLKSLTLANFWLQWQSPLPLLKTGPDSFCGPPVSQLMAV